MKSNIRIILTLFQIGFSVASLFWVLYYNDFSGVTDRLLSIDFLNAFFVVATFSAIHLLKTLQWHILLLGWKVPGPFIRRLKWHFIALFLNNFLPTGFGGDVARVYHVYRQGASISTGAAVVAWDRVEGFMMLALWGCLAVLWQLNISSLNLGELLPSFLFATFIGFVAIPIIANYRRFLGMMYFLFRLLPSKVEVAAIRIVARFTIDRDRMPCFLSALPVAFLMQGCMILSYFLLAQALGMELGFSELSVFVPLLFLTMVIPISINGIGLREVLFATYFADHSLGSEHAVVLGIAHFMLWTLSSLPGGIIIALDPSRHLISRMKKVIITGASKA